MTEEEWQACTDPMRMLSSLRGKAGDRLLRLFAVACCRRIWDLLDTRGRKAVELGERLAEGHSIFNESIPVWEWEASSAGEVAAFGTVKLEAAEAADVAADYAAEAVGELALRTKVLPERVRHVVAERLLQSALLRCIFGPFRPVAPEAVWLAWNDGTIPKLAQAIYEERAFDRLPILADALEEAGCDNAAVLAHCREPGVHDRGCWVIDLLLGRK
jgi:hypothetical protein